MQKPKRSAGVVVAGVLLCAWCGALRAQPSYPSPEQVLTSRGLMRSGGTFLLKADIDLPEYLKPVRELKERMAQVERDRARFQRELRNGERQIAGWRAEYDVLDAKIKKTRDPANHNQYVKPINALVDKMSAARKACKETEQALANLPDLQPQHARAVAEACRALDAADEQYDALAEDPAVRAAQAAMNKLRPGAAVLGPSSSFRKELYVLRWTRQGYEADAYVAKYRDGRSGGGLIDATLNGAAVEPLAFDPEAAFVVLAPDAAARLGLRPADDARTMKLRTPDGKFADAKVAVLASVKVGLFTARDVECLIHPGDAAAPAASQPKSRLGKSFLKHFAPEVLTSSADGLKLVPLPDAPVRLTLATAPPAPAGADNIFDESGEGNGETPSRPAAPTAATGGKSRAGEIVRLRLPVPAADAGAAAAARAALAEGGRVRDGEVLTESFTFEPGEPYRLNGSMTVDEKAKGVDVIVGPGAEVRGGKIYLARGGHMRVRGTPDKPAVLRGVQVSMDLNGTFDAEFAVLDGCTFSKGGAWFAYHSSKWTFTNCTLYKSRFAGLTGVDYGFKIESCRLIGMTFPEIQPRRDKDKEFNHLSHLRHSWNRIRGCEFIDCTVPPTVAWCAEDSGFIDCTFRSGQAFEGADDFVWEAFVAGTKGERPQAVFDANPGSRGGVRAAARGQPVELPILGEQLIPELTYAERAVKREQ